jgi:hypothetical protein
MLFVKGWPIKDVAAFLHVELQRLVGEEARPIPPRLLERVGASAAGISEIGRLEAEVELLRARERSVVLQYRFEGGLRLIAKRYAQCGDALASYEVLRALRSQGFGPGSRHRVPEALGCFPDRGVLLMSAVPGHRLATLAGRAGQWEAGLRAAAGWLARLHGSSVELDSKEDITQGAFRLARRAARAAARHPDPATGHEPGHQVGEGLEPVSLEPAVGPAERIDAFDDDAPVRAEADAGPHTLEEQGQLDDLGLHSGDAPHSPPLRQHRAEQD